MSKTVQFWYTCRRHQINSVISLIYYVKLHLGGQQSDNYFLIWKLHFTWRGSYDKIFQVVRFIGYLCRAPYGLRIDGILSLSWGGTGRNLGIALQSWPLASKQIIYPWGGWFVRWSKILDWWQKKRKLPTRMHDPRYHKTVLANTLHDWKTNLITGAMFIFCWQEIKLFFSLYEYWVRGTCSSSYVLVVGRSKSIWWPMVKTAGCRKLHFGTARGSIYWKYWTFVYRFNQPETKYMKKFDSIHPRGLMGVTRVSGTHRVNSIHPFCVLAVELLIV